MQGFLGRVSRATPVWEIGKWIGHEEAAPQSDSSEVLGLPTVSSNTEARRLCSSSSVMFYELFWEGVPIGEQPPLAEGVAKSSSLTASSFCRGSCNHMWVMERNLAC